MRPRSFWGRLRKPILALAPMEGYTDSAFRQIAKQHGADLVYTEFLPSDAIGHRAARVLDRMAFVKSERPIVCQVFGRDLEMFRRSAIEVERRGFDGIDINFGCPARKVVGSGAGVALLRDPRYARELIQTVIEATKLPVSIKVRASIRKERREVAPGTQERVTALDLVEAIADLPVAAIMVHGRSYEGGFSGTVDTEMIREVARRFPGIVLANGGIRSPADVERMLEATAADGVGIARGAVGRPWIFSQARAHLAGEPTETPSWDEVRTVILAHAKLAVETKGARGLLELRKHLAAYVRGRPGAAALRSRLVRTSTIEDLNAALSLPRSSGSHPVAATTGRSPASV